MAVNLDYLDTSGCTPAGSAATQCRAKIADDQQCPCQKAAHSDFCATHRDAVAQLTRTYQGAEGGYSGQHTIDDLKRAAYSSQLSGAECRRVLNLLYLETAIRMFVSMAYYSDNTWGMVAARNRNGHVQAIIRREAAIARLERYCNTDDDDDDDDDDQ